MKVSLCLAILGSMVRAAVSQELGAYNVDPSLVSVSGLSSGAAMALQLGVAHSGTFQSGFGVFAAGPYDCGRDQPFEECGFNNVPSIAKPISHMKSWSGNESDSIENLQNRRIYLEVGTADPTVGYNPVKQLHDQMTTFADPANISFIVTKGAGHTFPTDFDVGNNAPCHVGSQFPYISNCQYDGAGAVLSWIYGKLNPRNDNEPAGRLLTFDQTGIFGAPGMAKTGYVYVPPGCKGRCGTCKLHVALHGCVQSSFHMNTIFIDNTGYKKWADTNKIIILYPQGTPDSSQHLVFDGTYLDNARACWDWKGWYGWDATQKSAVQMVAIVNQVKQLIGALE